MATGSEWKPLERSLPVVNWELLERSLPIVNWEPLERSLPVVNWEPLERSLPVVNWEFCQWGALRTLATGSELGILSMGSP